MSEVEQPLTDSDLKIQVDDFRAEAERFKSFDENFLPIELEHIKDSYVYILQQFTKKSQLVVKYHHLSEQYEKQVASEIEETARLDDEIKEFGNACQREQEQATKSIQFIIDYKQQFLDKILSLNEGYRDIILTFQAFYALGPEGYQGEPVNWSLIKDVLQNREKLTTMMTNIFNQRIKDISRVEIERAQEIIRNFYKEFSHDSDRCQPIAQAISTYVHGCVSYWDLAQAAQSRQELVNLKQEKLEYLKREIASYKEIMNTVEKEIEEMIIKYKKSKATYEDLSRESAKADQVMKRFEQHYTQLDQERNQEHRDTAKIERLLQDLQKDCDEFDTVKVRVFYKLPADTQIA
jgi:hypothetical protein